MNTNQFLNLIFEKAPVKHLQTEGLLQTKHGGWEQHPHALLPSQWGHMSWSCSSTSPRGSLPGPGTVPEVLESHICAQGPWSWRRWGLWGWVALACDSRTAGEDSPALARPPCARRSPLESADRKAGLVQGLRLRGSSCLSSLVLERTEERNREQGLASRRFFMTACATSSVDVKTPLLRAFVMVSIQHLACRTTSNCNNSQVHSLTG